MKLFIETSNTYLSERKYVFDVVFKEFLGLEYDLIISKERTDIKITSSDDNLDKELIMADILFAVPENIWLTVDSLPAQPLNIWNLRETPINITCIDQEIPVIYGNNRLDESFFQISEKYMNLGLDVFGSAFFMLTRYEEVVKSDRDQHGRFPAYASLAFQEKFLDRPIINEYIEILWWCLKSFWPDLSRKMREFTVKLTHDVDSLFAVSGRPWYRFVRSCGADLLIRKDLTILKDRCTSFHWIRKGDLNRDIYNNLDRIMDISEDFNLKSAFYFMTDTSSNRYDDYYFNSQPWVNHNLKQISQRGHEFGLHTSYNTYRDAEQTSKEFALLLQTCDSEGLSRDCWGGRQHYLRWENPSTWQNWENAGLNYDTTINYADCAGFRAGVCYEYPVFNLKSRQALRLIEKPLIVMECTLQRPNYMNLSEDKAYEEIIKLAYHCKIVKGTFVLLWHNTELVSRKQINFYVRILERITSFK